MANTKTQAKKEEVEQIEIGDLNIDCLAFLSILFDSENVTFDMTPYLNDIELKEYREEIKEINGLS